MPWNFRTWTFSSPNAGVSSASSSPTVPRRWLLRALMCSFPETPSGSAGPSGCTGSFPLRVMRMASSRMAATVVGGPATSDAAGASNTGQLRQWCGLFPRRSARGRECRTQKKAAHGWAALPDLVPYWSSVVAPASCSLAAPASASSLLTFSRTGLGAESTRSFASLRPRFVSSRTALMTLILLSPTPERTTVNSVFSSSSTGASPLACAGAGPPTATGAAALIPNFSSIALTAFTTSRTLHCSSASTNSSGVTLAAMSLCTSPICLGLCRPLRRRVGVELIPSGLEEADELPHRRLHRVGELADGALQRAQELCQEHLAGRQVADLPHLGGVEHLALDDTALDVEPEPCLPRELVDHADRRAELLVAERDRDRAHEELLERVVLPRLGDRPPGQRVLDHAVLDVRAPEAAPQVLHLADAQAAVVREHRRLGGLQLLAEQLDLLDFLGSCHPVPPRPDPTHARARRPLAPSETMCVAS